jgi:hypothetical protein
MTAGNVFEHNGFVNGFVNGFSTVLQQIVYTVLLL